ncbi:transcriptional activator cubitus interruptus isoform X2 [Drosophila takahashii]|uniref:transcriptional activator cubitus interruptus isoform X2 n=1 Tax=Drosophila takahashii TaxID=29030 RepID=UPI001CF8AAA2|nr:transcriptional activator cubitus interruptus isoform X2 [Drosophila takahashii]
MDAYALPTYFPLAYSELQFLASRRAAAAAAAATVLPVSPCINHLHTTDVSSSVTVPSMIPTVEASDSLKTSPSIQPPISNGNSLLANSSGHHQNHQHQHVHSLNVTGQPHAHDFHPAYRIPGYMEQLYSLQRNSTTASFHDPYVNCASAFHLAGLGLGSGDFLGTRGMGSLGDLHHAAVAAAAAGSLASTDFHFSIDGNRRLSSPRPPGGSIRASISRKRALSSSPYSDSFDINSMIRFSPNSLATIMNGSRGSSAASGSYGHISASAINPMSHAHSTLAPRLQQIQAHLLRASAGLLNPMTSQQAAVAGFSISHAVGASTTSINDVRGNLNDLPSQITPSSNARLVSDEHKQVAALSQKNFDDGKQRNRPHKNIVTEQPSSTSGSVAQVEADSASSHLSDRCYNNIGKNTKSIAGDVKISSRCEEFLNCGSASTPLNEYDCANADTTDIKDEPGDFIETNCHWRSCCIEFITQDELVKHINNDHIQTNKKAFVCRWEDCTRGEKPFKAQYMLVVHMRRHTGEKPHKCTAKNHTPANIPDVVKRLVMLAIVQSTKIVHTVMRNPTFVKLLAARNVTPTQVLCENMLRQFTELSFMQIKSIKACHSMMPILGCKETVAKVAITFKSTILTQALAAKTCIWEKLEACLVPALNQNLMEVRHIISWQMEFELQTVF